MPMRTSYASAQPSSTPFTANSAAHTVSTTAARVSNQNGRRPRAYRRAHLVAAWCLSPGRGGGAGAGGSGGGTDTVTTLVGGPPIEGRIRQSPRDHVYLCVGHIAFDDRNAALLTSLLPPLVIVRVANPHGRRLAQLTDLLATEVGAAAAGSPLVQNHLAQILLVHMLRAHAAQTDRPTGWLGALNEDGIGAALRAVHADVAHSWTLKELAEISHMSRSAFAQAFKNHVGTTPLEYLIQWRISLARDALARDTLSISELARATGYLSESAFSTAFRRVVGSSPTQFRNQARQPPRPAANRISRKRPVLSGAALAGDADTSTPPADTTTSDADTRHERDCSTSGAAVGVDGA
ncbi:AraC family transcriptional regulator [Streptomyces niveus]|uniref:helix-turn-helix transcriptional regulator n=1 Tax=Streptomyces niveus TaxID=193462 RepID=UPI00366771C9